MGAPVTGSPEPQEHSWLLSLTPAVAVRMENGPFLQIWAIENLNMSLISYGLNIGQSRYVPQHFLLIKIYPITVRRHIPYSRYSWEGLQRVRKCISRLGLP